MLLAEGKEGQGSDRKVDSSRLFSPSSPKYVNVEEGADGNLPENGEW